MRIIQLNEETHEFNEVAQFEHPYPATKMMWIPDANGAAPPGPPSAALPALRRPARPPHSARHAPRLCESRRAARPAGDDGRLSAHLAQKGRGRAASPRTAAAPGGASGCRNVVDNKSVRLDGLLNNNKNTASRPRPEPRLRPPRSLTEVVPPLGRSFARR